MKRFLTTTAVALVIGTSAMAEQHSATFAETSFDAAVNLYASDLLGARVYATEADISGMTSASTNDTTEWDDIGEINEIILTRDGNVQSVIVGVGGFIGIGEKDVSVAMSDLRFVSDGESPDEYFLVINANAAGITDAPAYERTSMTERQTETAYMTPPAITREGYQTAMVDDLTTEDLTGARVYGPNDEDVGEVSEILLTNDGKLDRAVIDVGGFLGMGEHPVAVTFQELTIVRMEDGSDVRVYIDSSQEALEAKPAYEG